MRRLFTFFRKRSGTVPDAPVRLRDAELSVKARNWLERLPEEMRPRELCERYPRIVNQLAACWADVGLIDHLLQDLLIDRRGGREGFPAEVIEEIALLYEYHDLRLRSEAIEAEDASPRA